MTRSRTALHFSATNQAELCYNGSAMSNNLTSIDISNMPDLVRLVEEVETTKTPRQLKRNNQTVAVLMPTTHVSSKKTDKTSVKKTLALAGAWGERKWNEVEAELDRIRHQSKPTPPFEL